MTAPGDSIESTGRSPVVVKFMAKKLRAATAPQWRRQLPNAAATWAGCEFVFDADCREYDWLVAYDDLSPVGDERFSTRVETLACPRQNTVLVTAEPSSIKAYGRDFCAQFGRVITSQEPWAIDGDNAHFVQSGYPWFYGRGTSELRRYDHIRDHVPLDKSETISTVCSSKIKGGDRLYRARVEFTGRLEQALPELQRFGRGVRFIDDKADALDAFRYHVAIENDRARHYFTEKLTDPFLGACLPFYFGCPNAADYFPAESFIAIDIFDFDRALKTIRAAIAANEYEKRLPHILEARQAVLTEHNIFPLLAREIGRGADNGQPTEKGEKLYSRRALRKRGPGYLLRDLRDKRRIKRLRRKRAVET